MKISLHSLVLLPVFAAAVSASAQTIWHVDDDCAAPGTGTEVDPFCTIQDAVDAARNADTVLVRSGVYTGNGNRDISLFGKTIILKSSEGPAVTTIDSEGGPGNIHRGFFLIHGETPETVIDGFTITGGYLIGVTDGKGDGGGGAAIYIRDSSPTIRNCVIRENISETLNPPIPVDGRGGGIYVDGNSSAMIESCIVADNMADRRGGGMYIGYENSTVTVRNCLITGNSASNGGGIHNTFGKTIIINTTIAENAVVFSGGGINSENGGPFLGGPFLSNCNLWGNQTGSAGPQIFISGPALTIEYSNVQGGLEDVVVCCNGNGELIWGLGMIDADPLFVDPDDGDFRVSAGSPCIDAGNNLAVPEGVETDLNGGPRFLDDPSTPDTGNPDPAEPGLPIVDMGPYEFDPDDCNNNDVPDEQDIADGTSNDVDRNGIPDECQPDCNDNDIPDSYEINEGMSEDCNANAVPDQCDVADGSSEDCNDNATPDECDIGNGTSEDCDTNGVPDECDPDCNDNGEVDACDIADGFSHDCDGDNIPDECDPGPPILEQPADVEVEIGEFAFFTVQVEGLLLEYQWRKDGVDLVDSEHILGAQSAGVLIFDVQSTDAGEYDCVIEDLVGPICTTSDTATLTVLPLCPADFDNDGAVGAFDLAFLLGAWGPNPNHPADLNNDDIIGPADLAFLLGHWGPCR